MNYFYRWIEMIKECAFNSHVWFIYLFTVLLVLITQEIGNIVPEYSFKSFIIDLVVPFILYCSIIFFIIVVSLNIKINILSKFFFILRKLWWLILLKIFWNMCNMVFVGNNFFPEVNLGLIPIFVLFFTWIIILLLSAYLLPCYILKSNEKIGFDFGIFFNFFNKVFGKMIFGIIIALIFSGIFLILFAMICSYFSDLLGDFINPVTIKMHTENILSVTTQVLYTHLIALTILSSYRDFSMIA
jgi:hypothetical protein